MIKKKLLLFASLIFNSNRFLSSIVSILGGLIVGAVILLSMDYNPIEAYEVIVKGIFSRPSYIAYSLIYATPLILTGLSVGFAFRTGMFNIGAEGQFIIGALVAALVGKWLVFPAWLLIPSVLLVAAMAGALWGGFAGWLKVRFGVHEVISTIMLNLIAYNLSNHIVSISSLRAPYSESTYKILDSARLDFLFLWKTSEEGFAWRDAHEFFGDLLRAPVSAGLVVAIIAVIVVAFILDRTTLGFRLKSVGQSVSAAQYAGINVRTYSALAMAIAGGLAGLAGAVHVMGNSYSVSVLKSFEGMGFDGIIVSLLGGNTPWGIFFSAIFYGGLKYGGGKIQPAMGAPTEIINIIIGVIIILVSLPIISQMVEKARKKVDMTGKNKLEK